jgi:hypothetical protein
MMTGHDIRVRRFSGSKVGSAHFFTLMAENMRGFGRMIKLMERGHFIMLMASQPMKETGSMARSKGQEPSITRIQWHFLFSSTEETLIWLKSKNLLNF